MNNSVLIFWSSSCEVSGMLQFTITTDSDGKYSGPSSIRLSSATNDVHETEVAGIWTAIKDGKFEEHAKQMLERFCARRGLDPAKLLLK